MNQIHSLDIQQKVLELYQSAIPVKEIALRTGVSRSRVYAYTIKSSGPTRNCKAPPMWTTL